MRVNLAANKLSSKTKVLVQMDETNLNQQVIESIKSSKYVDLQGLHVFV